ncbi:MAG: hypothetical protein TH68_04200 [Candidatus Synechococcus spongiarum 142]|uniref:Uncharacterized protein n=1 Tax=Candidatus Synechococcus spongiarum 142 TaxID=1608213 RepID=A0A6N3X8S8_9SYNE|nr:MAG: hypothetical protein TH68_04200 [Candidatus Synechococcus spongiarum 142]
MIPGGLRIIGFGIIGVPDGVAANWSTTVTGGAIPGNMELAVTWCQGWWIGCGWDGGWLTQRPF